MDKMMILWPKVLKSPQCDIQRWSTMKDYTAYVEKGGTVLWDKQHKDYKELHGNEVFRIILKDRQCHCRWEQTLTLGILSHATLDFGSCLMS